MKKTVFTAGMLLLILSLMAVINAASTPWAVVPFYVAPAKTVPTIDGKIDAGEWAGAYTYPFLFNQLSASNLTPPPAEDSSGSWALLYSGDTIYGVVRRQDDKTFIDHPDAWENDCVELFFKNDAGFYQLRSLVGKPFDRGFGSGKIQTAWSEDGTVLEFAVQIPGTDLAGKNMGFNIALADNDGRNRKTQLYPIPGANRSWQQRDLAEIALLRPGKSTPDLIIKSFAEFPAFLAKATEEVPVIDGQIDEDIWRKAVVYPFGFNQLNSTNQIPPPAQDSSGNWALLYKGDTIYGLVRRQDDTTYIGHPDPWENDCVELFIEHNMVFSQLRALVGKPFDRGFAKGKVETAWSTDGTVLEFAVQIPGVELAGTSIAWNIALADNDGRNRKTQLYPIPGFNRSWQQQDLAELRFAK